MMKNFVLKMILIYRRSTSRYVVNMSQQCIFHPTCSAYMFIAIHRFGLIKGITLGVKRLIRCNPYKSDGGHDPVPH